MKKQRLDDAYPLSPMQQGMLFHNLYAPHSGVDIEQMLIRLHEPLDISAFKQAWQHIVDRHPVLRTSFHWKGLTVPLQQVHKDVLLAFDKQDWRAMPASEQEHRLRAYLRTDRQQGFVLTEAPLMRVGVFRLGEADYHCLWTFHHILLDGRSLPILLKEVFAFYEAYCNGQILERPFPRPYRDHIEHLQQQDIDGTEGFWRSYLKGFSSPTPLIVERKIAPTESQKTYSGSHQLQFSKGDTSALRAFAQCHDLTLNTLLQGAWALLLSRYSDESDVVFGTTRAGRRSSVEGAEAMVGLFINTLPIRVHLSPEMSLLSWLKELRAQWLTLRAYEHTPLIKVQEWSELSGGTPLFESLVLFDNYHFHDLLQAQGEEWKNREFRIVGQSNYPLVARIRDTGLNLLLELSYHQHRFDAAAISRIADHLHVLLLKMIADPNRRLSEFSLLTETEWQQIAMAWNTTYTDYSRHTCIHQLFEERVEHRPDAIAIIFDDQYVTYRELNARANQLAYYLTKHEFGPEVLIGLCMERSLEMIVGILGILKAGGTYVPLDPTYPRERLACMLKETQTPLLLTQSHLLPSFPDFNLPIICLDAEWDIIRQESQKNPSSNVNANNAAYVMYTSGSTGQPKGVMIQHRNVVRLVKNVNYATFNADEVWLQLAPLAFDASTFEIWGSLLNGAQLVVAPPHRLSLEELGEMLRQHHITTLWLTSGLFHLMVDMRLEALAPLYQLFAGGDVLSRPHVEKVLRTFDGIRMINGYGPTENTTFTCCYPMTLTSQLRETVPIGFPVSNTQVYILDRFCHPRPIGVPGEVYIGGDGLARGYLHRPDLTAEKFLPNPFSHEPGSRLYKSGDIARYLPDGTIEFLGRQDHQVKLRGFRIELGEIETVLRQHPAVRQAVVTVRDETSDNKRLAAYIVEEKNKTLKTTGEELRTYLRQKLPDYMIPSVFVFLETLPLTPNGKVDRNALPAPDQSRSDINAPFVAPQNPIEEIIAGIWAKVLDLEHVGSLDNFFALGGHSLLATQIMSRVNALFQLDVPLRQLFETPTVAGLAAAVDTARQAGQRIPPPSIFRVPRNETLPLSFAQQRLWFLDQLAPGNSLYHIAYAVRLTGVLDVAALEQSFKEIVRRHEALRTHFPIVNGQAIQEIDPPSQFSLSVTELQSLLAGGQDTTARQYISEEAREPFNLSQGPLFRAIVFCVGDKEHILLFVMHHSISDGWSMHILFQELSELYTAFFDDTPCALPELPIQYADFAVWQRKWLQDDVLNTQLSYWKAQLNGTPDRLILPISKSMPSIQSFRGAQHSFVLSKALTQALKRLSQQEGMTLFMMLLAAFNVLLFRYTGQEDCVIGSPIANRNRTEIEPLIGFFVNTLVLRMDLSGNPTCRILLKRVREICLSAYAHQDLPFEKLVEELQPDRNLAYHPIFQVGFALQNTPHPSLELTGLEISQINIPDETAKFDLALTLNESEDRLLAVLGYATDLFEASTIRRMSAHYRTVLEGIVDNPDVSVTDIALLTKAEQQQILKDWNNTQVEYPKDLSIHQLFEEQVERSPDAIAVVFGDQQLSYRELNSRANQLARYLKDRGVGPEVLVGIYLERSLEMIIALLGILKAGGAFVPLDPFYPRERLRFMAQDAKIPVLITQQQFMATLPEYRGKIVYPDNYWSAMISQHDENVLTTVTGSNIAYVIYTSGSTGQPKGVITHHRGFCNIITASIKNFYLQPNSRLLQHISSSFDGSIWEIFMALLTGATLCLASKPGMLSGTDLRQELHEQAITVAVLIPSVLATLPKETFSPLHTLIVGAESCSPDLVNQWSPHRHFFNTYGPTEASINVSFIECTGRYNQQPPIGRPTANMQIYLLDQQQQLVPVGVPGELYIGGVGLARGYLNRPDLTVEKFIPNPFSEQPGERLYKTGDLARYLPDGNIEFLGRLDHQVKLRGFRIEPGEIESILIQHPAVQQVIVMLREDEPENKRLIAYIVQQLTRHESQEDFRRYLKQRLPEYMIPSAFVMLDTLPLTPNGKIDRKSLPAPELNRPELTKQFVAPRTPIEQSMADIWKEVLKLEQVGIHDNFFDLGGHSLAAIKLVSNMRTALNYRFSVKDLFLQPTIASLSEMLEALPSRGTTTQSVLPAHTVPESEPSALSNAASSLSSPFLRIEHRSLLSLISTGEMKPVDAAALGYLPISRFSQVPEWFHELPVCTRIIETFLGRIAVIILPVFDSELYANQDALVELIVKALKMATVFGARTVSLTGLLPSATNHGQAVVLATKDTQDLPAITTGHATTAATVVLNLRRILEESGRDLSEERVGILGLGSICATTLKLMLQCLPHPREIFLCDLYSKRQIIEKIRQDIIKDYGFLGTIHSVQSQSTIPAEFYGASFIIGATNVPDVLDISCLNPGTLVVDDSGPHCFEVEMAIHRLEYDNDILFTEGGVLQSPQAIHSIRYVPKEAGQELHWQNSKKNTLDKPFTITGCVLSALLSACFEELSPTVSMVDIETCWQHYQKLQDLGFQAAELHCGEYVLPQRAIKAFREHFGQQRAKS